MSDRYEDYRLRPANASVASSDDIWFLDQRGRRPPADRQDTSNGFVIFRITIDGKSEGRIVRSHGSLLPNGTSEPGGQPGVTPALVGSARVGSAKRRARGDSLREGS